ncbi:MAG TPA: hypothetical protein VF629_14365 [Hymenobacter sp.]|jgi:hypothetical protein|uniref:hypothetical protein n=1 Tax=Hymenobacter sp. TaxID=1898978 RepID=UPI002ED92D20
MSAYFAPIPPHLALDQRLQCARRQLVAENILDTMIANGTTPDESVLSYLQGYIDGDSTLGQAVGRIVDHFASSQPVASQDVTY